MASAVPLNWARVVRAGVIAGIAGGIAIDVFLFFAAVLPQHGSLPGLWSGIAATAMGKGVLQNSAAPLMGAVLHFCVSIGWACGYAYMAQTRDGIDRHWFTSGLVFGIVVYVAMQIVLMAANAFHRPVILEFVIGVLAHTVFFGLPVAATVRAVDRT